MKPKVYLAGAISGKTFGECTDWRAWAKEMLAPEIDAFSPMRCKEFLRREKILGSQPYNDHVLSTSKGITTRDRNDVYTSDLVLMNLLDTTIVSIGSMIELGWADAFRKPVVLVMKEGEIHDHCIVQHVAGFIVPTLEEGCLVARAILIS